MAPTATETGESCDSQGWAAVELSLCNAKNVGTRRASPTIVDQHLRRAFVILRHYRRHNLPIDARQIAHRALATQPPATARRYRALVEQAIDSVVRGFR